MGYDTSHEYIGSELTESQIERLAEISGYSLDKFIDGYPCQWYDKKNHLINFSREVPEILLEWKCQGEDGEEYKVYAKNGKYATIEPDISWPEFEENMLS